MADTQVLLNGLEEYRKSLQRHLDTLDSEYAELEVRWQMLQSVYEGRAAREFKEGWVRTQARFQEYQDRTAGIARMLDERIEHLRDANRPENVG